MKLKYMTGFFSVLLFLALLTAGYRFSYRMMMDRQEKAAENTQMKNEIVQAEGQAMDLETEHEGGFYICSLHGYTAVYLDDKKTIYEVTGIELASLPGEVRREVEAGKYVKTEQELYAFLENYSS